MSIYIYIYIYMYMYIYILVSEAVLTVPKLYALLK